jgi:hypothetical protein
MTDKRQMLFCKLRAFVFFCYLRYKETKLCNFVKNETKNSCIFVNTYWNTYGIIILVKTPNTLYSFLLSPIVKNTFSLEKAADRWLLFHYKKI